jgi:two-component system, response regulator, stage 0 sporulation protein F
VLGTICANEGHKVTKANSGREALDLCRAEHIDLAIIDIDMPDMNGLDLIRRLRTNFDHIKIIAISGGSTTAGKDVLQLARERGASHTFGKPFQLLELKETIQELLET